HPGLPPVCVQADAEAERQGDGCERSERPRIQRENTVPCGTAVPVKPCGQVRPVIAIPGRALPGSLNSESIASIPVAGSKLITNSRAPSLLHQPPSSTTRRPDGSIAIQCGPTSAPSETDETSRGCSVSVMSSASRA